MRHLAILTASALALAGCAGLPIGGWTIDGRIDEIEAAKIDGAVALIQQQDALWNAAGFDPLQMPQAELALASTACASLSLLGALADQSVGVQVQHVCRAVMRVVAPAAQVVAPLPEPTAPVVAPTPEAAPAG